MTEPDRTFGPALGWLAYPRGGGLGPVPASSGWLDTRRADLGDLSPWEVAQSGRDGYERIEALLRAESPRPLPVKGEEWRATDAQAWMRGVW